MKRSLFFKVSTIFFLLTLLGTVILWFPAQYSAQSVSYSYQAVNRYISVNGSYCGQSSSCNIVGSGAAYHQLSWNVVGTLSGCSITVDSSADGVTWSSGGVISAKTCTSNPSGPSTSTSVVPNYVRMTVSSLAGTGTLSPILTGFLNNPSGGGGSGTVTEVDTSSPITGGPITTTGTLACATCTTAAASLTSGNVLTGSGGQALAASGKAAPSGAFVGTTDSQTLTTKVLNGASNGNSVTLLSNQFDGTSHAGTGAEAILFTYTIPANTVGAGKGIIVNVSWQHTTGTNSGTYRVRLGGIGGTAHAAVATASVQPNVLSLIIMNKPGVTNAQYGMPGVINQTITSAPGGTPTTSTIDMTSNQDLVFTFNLPVTTDALTPLGFNVESIN